MKSLKEGMIHIYTGKGKGKTTAAIGLVLRAAGAGFKVCIIQFLKGYTDYNEIRMLKRLVKGCKVIRFKQVHPMFCSKKKMRSAKKALKRQLIKDFQQAKEVTFSKKYDVIIMDEIINVVSQNFMPEIELIKFIDKRPKGVELILTGRGASQKLKKKADYVTEMRLIRHPFYKGKEPRKGIEY